MKGRERETLTSPLSTVRVIAKKEFGSSFQLLNFSLHPAQGPTYSGSRRFSPAEEPAPSTYPHPGRRAGLRRPSPDLLGLAGPGSPGRRGCGSRSPGEGAGREGRGRKGANQRARLWSGRDWPAPPAPTSPASLGPLSHCIP